MYTSSDDHQPPSFRFSWDWQKLFVGSTPIEKFVSRVATRVFLPMTKGGKGERAWEQGCFLELTTLMMSCIINRFFAILFSYKQKNKWIYRDTKLTTYAMFYKNPSH